MASPVHATNHSPSPSSSSLSARRAKIMQSLPPVFSPDNSPPMGAASRKHYLPLVSPAPNEEGQPFDFSIPRRGSTPSLAKSSASQYFEELRKRRRTSESSFPSTSANNIPVAVEEEKESQSVGRFAELPSSIAQSILRALQSRAESTNSNSSASSLKKRTMSMPCASVADSEEVSGYGDGMKRRASMRSQQLALLASQARLARTGTTSVHTALRAERAVEGAVRKVLENAQASKTDTGTIKEEEELEQTQAPSEKAESKSAEGERKNSIADLQESAPPWSDALSSPQTASAFLSRASEVAHDWATGFYRFEERWAEDALQKEKRRLSEHHVGNKRPRIEDLLRESTDDSAGEAPMSPKRVISEPTTRETSPSLKETISNSVVAPPSVRSSLVAAHKRLSASLPAVPSISNVCEGGQLVDVLSNFASLIEQRKEGCHGLEKLAQDARKLSTVQLPSLSTAIASQSFDDDEEDQDEEEG